jgi:hypothetical protein
MLVPSLLVEAGALTSLWLSVPYERLEQGGIPKRMMKKGMCAAEHFDLADANCPFISVEHDPLTNQQVGECG